MSMTEAQLQLLALFNRSTDPAILQELMTFIFTPEEQAHLETRLQLISELLRGEKTQREIAKELNISIAKITRGSNGLKTISPALKCYLQSILAGSG